MPFDSYATYRILTLGFVASPPLANSLNNIAVVAALCSDIFLLHGSRLDVSDAAVNFVCSSILCAAHFCVELTEDSAGATAGPL